MADSLWTDNPQSAVRRPRAQLLANGAKMYGLYECSASDNNQLKPGKWDAHLAVSEDPNFDWGQRDITITVQMMFLPDDAPEGTDGPWTSLLSGKVDDVHYDPGTMTCHISGRDLTSVLIDAKIQFAFPNQTTSEIIQKIASGHGWHADVTPTTQPVGAYYKAEHDTLALGNFSKSTTEWDLICKLVRQEGQDVWTDLVDGVPTIYTRPSQDVAAASKVFHIIYVPPGGNSGADWPSLNVATDVQLERSLTLAKDIKVTVKTWDAKSKSSKTVSVSGNGSVSAKGKTDAKDGQVQEHVFIKPGLTPDAALRFARQQALILTQLERVVTVKMPGELQLTPRDVVELSGLTGGAASWNQRYYVDTIERPIKYEDGFDQTVRLKNSSPRTETTS